MALLPDPFVTFAMTVMAMLLKGGVSIVHSVIALAFLAPPFFRDHFNIPTYTIGVAEFVLAGQGAMRSQA